eukprot:gene3912-6393_t
MARRILATSRHLLHLRGCSGVGSLATQNCKHQRSLSDMASKFTVTVCGGGNAAHVAAGMFAHQGATVNLFFSFEDEAKRFREGCKRNGGVTVHTHTETYVGTPNVITSKAEEAIPGSDMILIITPAFAHEPILKQLADHLDHGAFVGAIPGPGAFDLLARNTLGSLLQEKNITLFGGSSLPWACRFLDYGAKVELLGEKSKVPICTYPDSQQSREDLITVINAYIPLCQQLESILNTIHKQTKFTVGGHFLNTTLWCTNAIIHPGISYGIWHDWDGKPVKEPPLFYQNCNDFTANVLQELSNEIQACRDILAEQTKADMSVWQPIGEYMIDTYGHVISDHSSLSKIFATNDAFRGLTAPCTKLDDGTFMPNFKMRYLTEDLPHGLAVLRGVAELCGVATPMMDAVLLWGQEKIGHEYLVDGKIRGKDVAHSGCPQSSIAEWNQTGAINAQSHAHNDCTTITSTHDEISLPRKQNSRILCIMRNNLLREDHLRHTGQGSVPGGVFQEQPSVFGESITFYAEEEPSTFVKNHLQIKWVNSTMFVFDACQTRPKLDRGIHVQGKTDPLKGNMYIHIQYPELLFRETASPDSKHLANFPIPYLRSYGQSKQIFVFEAGRRCALGPKKFVFKVQKTDLHIPFLISLATQQSGSTPGYAPQGQPISTPPRSSSKQSSAPETPKKLSYASIDFGSLEDDIPASPSEENSTSLKHQFDSPSKSLSSYADIDFKKTEAMAKASLNCPPIDSLIRGTKSTVPSSPCAQQAKVEKPDKRQQNTANSIEDDISALMAEFDLRPNEVEYFAVC